MNPELIILQIGKIRDKANSFLTKELMIRQLKGIAPSHGDIMGALFTNGDLPMKKLAEIINRDKSTVTALVKKTHPIRLCREKSGCSGQPHQYGCFDGKGPGDTTEFLGGVGGVAEQGLSRAVGGGEKNPYGPADENSRQPLKNFINLFDIKQ